MTNPIDFAAKSMLVEAIRIGLTGSGDYSPALGLDDWKLTDSELIYNLSQYKPSGSLIRRLRTGDLFDLVGLFWADKRNFFAKGLHVHSSLLNTREILAGTLGCGTEEILIYLISDKRTRPITGLSFRNKMRPENPILDEIGSDSNLLLVGICIGRKTLATKQTQSKCQDLLWNITGDQTIDVCKPEDHLPPVSAVKKMNGQMTLFTK